MSRIFSSLFQGGDSTLLLWADLIKIDSLQNVSGLWLCPKLVAIGTDPLLDLTGCGNGSRAVC